MWKSLPSNTARAERQFPEMPSGVLALFAETATAEPRLGLPYVGGPPSVDTIHADFESLGGVRPVLLAVESPKLLKSPGEIWISSTRCSPFM